MRAAVCLKALILCEHLKNAFTIFFSILLLTIFKNKNKSAGNPAKLIKISRNKSQNISVNFFSPHNTRYLIKS